MNENCSNRIAGSGRGMRRADRLGPYAVDQFTLEVPDLDAGAEFVEACGLTARKDGDTVSVLASNPDHVWLRMVPGPRKRLARLSFAAYAEDIAPLRARIEGAGYAITESSPERFLLTGPDGVEVEVVARDRSELEVEIPEIVSDVALRRSASPDPRVIKLSHIAVFTTDVEASLKFYTGLLGLALADRSGEGLCFLYAPHGSDHHVMALVGSAGPGVHHYSWEMGSVDALGLRATIAAEKGFKRGWGFGRHVLGSNYFHYVRDPWGSHLELTAGIEYIPADIDHVAADHPPADAFYLWGPPPPEGFVDNHEVGEPVAA